MTVDQFHIEMDEIVSTKRERLRERQIKTPNAAVFALAEMQTRPYPILNVVTGGETISVIGRITYGKIYDPVGTALRYARLGIDSVGFFTDHQVYDNGLEDMLLVARAIKYPIVCQDYILDGYHVAEARAAGASGLTIYSSILDAVTLRRAVSLTQRWRMTAIMQVENEAQLDAARDLSPHVIAIGTLDPFDIERDLRLLEQLRPYIPYNTHCMLLDCIPTLDAVAEAIQLGVDAVVVGENILSDPVQTEQLYKLIHSA